MPILMRGITCSAIVNASGYWHNASSLSNDIYRGLTLQASDAGIVLCMNDFSLCGVSYCVAFLKFIAVSILYALPINWWFALNWVCYEQTAGTVHLKICFTHLCCSKPVWLSLFHKTQKLNFEASFCTKKSVNLQTGQNTHSSNLLKSYNMRVS